VELATMAPAGDQLISSRRPRRSKRARRPTTDIALNGRDSLANAPSAGDLPSPTPSATSSGQSQPTEKKTNSVHRGIKRNRPHRRGGTKRNVKRIDQMSTEERNEYEQRQQQKAEELRARRFANGAPMAPYNTGQFLMDDRLSRDQEAAMGSDTEHGGACAGRRRHRTASDTRTADQLSGDEATNSGNSDSLEREFDIEMDASRSETLCEMSKEELVTMCLRLETKQERQSVELAQMRRAVEKLTRDNDALRLVLPVTKMAPET